MADEIRYVEEKLPAADVSGLVNAVNSMNSQVTQLSYEVAAVNTKVNTVTSEFAAFLQDFRRYVVQDIQDRRYQEALQDQVSIQQQLDDRFSQHQKVRRYVTGILQASDSKLVKKEVMETATSELMISIPHYWLVPALVALSAWINDNRELAETALREAISRDDEKTSLLFALICRRASRNNATMVWLKRYFAMQDPMDIERKMIVVLDAYANGLFGGDSRSLCAEQIGGWIAEMEDVAGFRETQVSRWEQAIEAKTPSSIPSSYSYLEKYATNWSELRAVLRNCSLHQTLLEYIKGILEQPNGETGELKKQLDELLDSLVTNYDNAELPLWQQKRVADLIIECKGDEAEALRRFDAERSAFDAKSDLMQLLTNAAMNPELVHASEATQKLSLAVSKDWMIEAYDNVTLKNRMAFVQEVKLNIEDFACETIDGDNEEKIRENAKAHFESIRDNAISQVKQNSMDFFLLGAGILVFVISLFTELPWFIGLLAAGFGVLKFFLGKKKVKTTIENLYRQYEEILHQVNDTVKAICAEVVDFRREVAALDKNYDATMAYMQEIVVHQFVKTGGERNVHIA